ncbi:TetR/AcrR family transcriptional regulator [Streptomyces sp. NPDC002143]
MSDSALRLFLEQGYDQVGLKDVAEAADVAVSTVFKHFSGKEALIFDEDADQEAALIAAVRERGPGQSVLDAVRDHLVAVTEDALSRPGFAEYRALVDSTPALNDYSHRMWRRHESSLASVIAEETGAAADDIAVRALARFALEAIFLTRGSGPAAADQIRAVFRLLRTGWGELGT